MAAGQRGPNALLWDTVGAREQTNSPGTNSTRPAETESRTVDLHDYLRVVRKRWRTITAVTLLLVAVAALLTLSSPKVYQAHTQLFVSTSGSSDSTQLLQGNTFTQERVKSYAAIVSSPTGPPSYFSTMVRRMRRSTTSRPRSSTSSMASASSAIGSSIRPCART